MQNKNKEMKKMTGEYRVFDKLLLIEANEAAIREERGRSIERSILEKLPLNLMYFVVQYIVHHQGEIRLAVQLNNKQIIYLDVSDLRFETLPIVRFYEDGSHETEYFKRPYPYDRQWKEVIQKKPIRKQSGFRKQVLTAYNSCCALCSIKEKSLLRAAHIVDVKHGGMENIDNGILLCVNHEIAFDNGKLRINPDYTVDGPHEIGIEVTKIKLPTKKEDYPSSELLKKKISLFELRKK
jgi:putative restriction endonuclease